MGVMGAMRIMRIMGAMGIMRIMRVMGIMGAMRIMRVMGGGWELLRLFRESVVVRSPDTIALAI